MPGRDATLMMLLLMVVPSDSSVLTAMGAAKPAGTERLMGALVTLKSFKPVVPEIADTSKVALLTSKPALAEIALPAVSASLPLQIGRASCREIPHAWLV